MKERIIYNNYDLYDNYYDDALEDIKQWREFNESDPDNAISEDDIIERIYVLDGFIWDDEHERLKNFFDNNGYFMLRGYAGRWDGNLAAGYIFNDFDDMYYKATKDCDYIKMWDENGHFYLECSHHDGTNIFEIKRINEKAYNFIDNWQYNWNDKRTEEEIHNIVWNSNFLSSLPHYAYIVYGCKKYE